MARSFPRIRRRHHWSSSTTPKIEKRQSIIKSTPYRIGKEINFQKEQRKIQDSWRAPHYSPGSCWSWYFGTGNLCIDQIGEIVGIPVRNSVCNHSVVYRTFSQEKARPTSFSGIQKTCASWIRWQYCPHRSEQHVAWTDWKGQKGKIK